MPMMGLQQGELDNALRGLKEGNAFRKKRENRRSILAQGSFPPFFFVMLCYVLFCSVLFCSVLFCSVLFCFVFVLFCFVFFLVSFVLFLFCFVLFCFVLTLAHLFFRSIIKKSDSDEAANVAVSIQKSKVPPPLKPKVFN